MIVYCACGQPLHYADPEIRKNIEQINSRCGADVSVSLGKRTWIVQRHYLALHKTQVDDLPNLKFPELLDNDRTYLPYKFDDGGTIVDPHNRDYTDQIYSHLDTDGRERHFHVTKLRRLIIESFTDIPQPLDQCALGVFPVNDEQAAIVAGRSLLDENHIARISGAYLNEPGIICLFDDDSQLIVDGNHRYIKRNRLELETMEFWLAPESIWRLTLLEVPSSLISF